ncbi:MAG: Uma2 family endonuclease [Caldilinea sp. CFX5]|nr:Uma2 family endonuclease [Caldilinea sp. CFX5]
MVTAIVDPDRVTLTKGIYTYEDYLQLPNDGKRYEIIEGVLYVANAPSFQHQYTVHQLDRQMGNFVSEQRVGYIIPAPFEVHLSALSRPVQPDITFIRAERINVQSLQIFEGAPDLIVEVLSPESIRRDRVIKFTAYEAAGVTEYWIVNPHARTVEVYILARGEYATLGEFKDAETIQSQVLAGIAIVTNSLFA